MGLLGGLFWAGHGDSFKGELGSDKTNVKTAAAVCFTQVEALLMASDGIVLEPSEADLAAAAMASDPSTAWLGCIVAEGALMDGSVVAVVDGVATAEDCCRACRADSKCNVWNFCSQQGGCR